MQQGHIKGERVHLLRDYLAQVLGNHAFRDPVVRGTDGHAVIRSIRQLRIARPLGAHRAAGLGRTAGLDRGAARLFATARNRRNHRNLDRIDGSVHIDVFGRYTHRGAQGNRAVNYQHLAGMRHIQVVDVLGLTITLVHVREDDRLEHATLHYGLLEFARNDYRLTARRHNA